MTAIPLTKNKPAINSPAFTNAMNALTSEKEKNEVKGERRGRERREGGRGEGEGKEREDREGERGRERIERG
jgi:hypothetical protein